MGMIGGGPGAFIGAVHRIAACLDGDIELVCGAFSSDPVKSHAMGKQLGLSSDRVYDTYRDMIEQEKKMKSNLNAICRKKERKYTCMIVDCFT
jgi:glutamate-1-semialdehyde aminotransferase